MYAVIPDIMRPMHQKSLLEPAFPLPCDKKSLCVVLYLCPFNKMFMQYILFVILSITIDLS